MLRSIELSNSPTARYGIAILSVAIALGLALLFRDFGLQVPLLLMAIAIAVWYGTMTCGLLAIVLSVASLDYFFIPPLYHFEIDLGHLPYFLVFTLFAVVIGSLSAARRRAEQLLREARNELESRVVERTAELQRRSAEAEAAQQRYSDLVNSVEGIVWEADASSFRFLFVSQHAQRVLGYPVEQWLAEPTFWTDHLHPDDREWGVDFCRRATTGKRNHEFEYRMIAADGRVVWLRDLVTTVVEEDRTMRLRGAMFDITSRKQAETALREQANLLNLTHDGIFVRDMHSVIKFWNRGAEELYGWKAEQALGNTSHQLLRTVFPMPLEQIEAALFNTGRWEGELVHTKPDGTQVVVASRWALQRDDQNRPLAVLETNNDITDRNRAEEELRERERRYRYIFQTAAVSIWEEDFSGLKAAIDDLRSHGVSDFRQYVAAHPEFVAKAVNMVRVIDVNDATVKLFAATSKDELLVSLNKIFLRETEEVFAAELIAIGEGRTSLESETVVQTLKGDRLTVLLAITFPSQPDKLDRVLVSIMDITARKRAEEALRESEDRYRRLIELSPDGIGVHHDGRIVFVNPALVQISGATQAEQLLGRSVIDLIHPDSREMVKRRIAYMLTTGAPAPFVEQKFIRLDGTPINVEVAAVPFKYQGLPSVQIIARDITERKRNEEALRQAQADLAHVSRVTTMGELTASLAHEVNQPITAAVMNANSCLRWLGRDDPDVEKARQAASRIVKDGTRAADIISRVRLLFKKGTPQRELIDVNDVIREMILLLNNEVTRHSVAVRTDIAADLPQVMVDRVQLQQVLMNLMINAIDAMKSVHRNRELTLTSRRDPGEQIVVSVSDTGVGLPPDADQIFNAFFTTKPHGTGMGLAISRSIVESYGGRLWATSNPDCGTTFHIALPTGVEALPE